MCGGLGARRLVAVHIQRNKITSTIKLPLSPPQASGRKALSKPEPLHAESLQTTCSHQLDYRALALKPQFTITKLSSPSSLTFRQFPCILLWPCKADRILRERPRMSKFLIHREMLEKGFLEATAPGSLHEGLSKLGVPSWASP